MIEARHRALADSLATFLRDRGMRVGIMTAVTELEAAISVVLRVSGQRVNRSGGALNDSIAPPTLVAQLLIYLRASARIIGFAQAAREIEEACGAAEKECGLRGGGGFSSGVLTRDPIAVLPQKRRRA